MAKIFRVPESEVGPPPKWSAGVSTDKLLKQEEEWIKGVQKWARERDPMDKFAGELYRYQIADGYALYVVISSSPLHLVWLPIGDAWQMPVPAARGLRISDIKKQLDFEREWKELTNKN